MFRRKDLVTLEPQELAPVDRGDTITRASRFMGSMVETLALRRVTVEDQLATLHEELRQINHVLNYAEPALSAIEGGRNVQETT